MRAGNRTWMFALTTAWLLLFATVAAADAPAVALSAASKIAPAAELSAAPIAAGADDGTFTDDPTPFVSGYQARRAQYLAACAQRGMTGGGTYEQACVARFGGTLRAESFAGALSKMNNREDTADFQLQGIIRIMAGYWDSANFPPGLKDGILDAVANFKYWIDEPGTDTMVFWSENHQLLFHTAAFVLGDVLSDTVFSNSGMTGAELRAKARPYIVDWLDHRLRWGFSEFHSDVYYNENGGPLANLIAFANDDEVRIKAMMVMDLMLYDMALGNHEGNYGMPHGRSYMKDKRSRSLQDTKAIMWLAFGKGDYEGRFDMTTTGLIDTDGYELPPVIEAIGASRPRGMVSRQRMGIDVADGPALGIEYDNLDDIIFWWGMEAYVAPETLEFTFEAAEEWDLFDPDNEFFGMFGFLQPLVENGILPRFISRHPELTGGLSLESANTYIYRTPETMLTSVQAWKPGTLGAQTHTWQATLGADQVVFTTYPGDLMDNSLAGHWTGGWHPSIGQHRTAAIVIHDRVFYSQILLGGVLNLVFPKYTHAYFPADTFDEVVETGKWVIGRAGDGYVALYSEKPTYWVTEGEWAGRELVADGRFNTWICEVGDATLYGSFENFVDAIENADVNVVFRSVTYESPGQGRMKYSWDGPLYVNGVYTAQDQFPRFHNPYGLTLFDEDDVYRIDRDGLSLTLDPSDLERSIGE